MAARSSPPAAFAGSRLLAALPPEVARRLEPDLATVHLGVKDVIYEPEGPIAAVYFPVSCVASVLTEMSTGDAVEVGTVGREGFVGLPVLLAWPEAPPAERAVCQVPGGALRLDVEPFQEALRRDPPLTALLLRYAGAFLRQVAQSTACNRLHTIDRRCARWLLMTHDRVRGDRFHLTQEFLSQMLGVRRASVNAVAVLLQQENLIRYNRGHIEILDRAGLEEAACECYRIIRREYERLLGAMAD